MPFGELACEARPQGYVEGGWDLVIVRIQGTERHKVTETAEVGRPSRIRLRT